MNIIKLGFDDKDKQEGKRKVLNLAAGGLAGAISNVAVAPIDTIKDVQRQNKSVNRNEMKDWEALAAKDPSAVKPRIKPESFNAVAKDIWSHEVGMKNKLKSFYAGTGAGVAKVAPAMAISFLAYDTLKDQIDDRFPKHTKQAELMTKTEIIMEKLALSGLGTKSLRNIELNLGSANLTPTARTIGERRLATVGNYSQDTSILANEAASAYSREAVGTAGTQSKKHTNALLAKSENKTQFASQRAGAFNNLIVSKTQKRYSSI